MAWRIASLSQLWQQKKSFAIQSRNNWKCSSAVRFCNLCYCNFLISHLDSSLNAVRKLTYNDQIEASKTKTISKCPFSSNGCCFKCWQLFLVVQLQNARKKNCPGGPNYCYYSIIFVLIVIPLRENKWNLREVCIKYLEYLLLLNNSLRLVEINSRTFMYNKAQF